MLPTHSTQYVLGQTVSVHRSDAMVAVHELLSQWCSNQRMNWKNANARATQKTMVDLLQDVWLQQQAPVPHHYVTIAGRRYFHQLVIIEIPTGWYRDHEDANHIQDRVINIRQLVLCDSLQDMIWHRDTHIELVVIASEFHEANSRFPILTL
jgi:hypothetical protein